MSQDVQCLHRHALGQTAAPRQVVQLPLHARQSDVTRLGGPSGHRFEDGLPLATSLPENERSRQRQPTIRHHRGRRNLPLGVLQRKASCHAPQASKARRARQYKEKKIQVLIARNRSGKISDLVDPALKKATIHEFLAPIIERDSILCSDGHSWYQTFSRDYGVAHHRLIAFDNQRALGKEYHIQNVNSYMSRLKGWMARIHGMGTAYLPNYLAWQQLFETAKPAEES